MSAPERIPLVDLHAVHAPMRTALLDAMTRVLDSGRFILGPEVDAFERELAELLGVPHAVGVSCGSDALVLALRAAGVRHGDGVITSAFSFVASVEAIARIGARPILCDIDPVSLALAPDAVRASITETTRAVLPVHVFGMPADMTSLRAIADEHELALVEDGAQALGSTTTSGPVGALADAAAFSFFPTKNLGALGDGGAVTTTHPGIAARVRALRQHGFGPKKAQTRDVGYNARLDALQAACLRVKLDHLEPQLEQRRAAARRYDAAIAEIDGIEPAIPSTTDDAEPAHHLYSVRIPAAQRDAVQAALKARGVSTRVYYRRGLHEMAPYRDFAERPLPEVERATRELLALPFWPGMPEDVQRRVVGELRVALSGEG